MSSLINLYDYQLDAIKRMKNGCILCGNVGSGKSRTGIGYYFQTQGGSVKPYRPMVNPCDLYIITTARKRDTLEWLGDLIPYLLSTNPEINFYKNKVIIDSWNNIHKYIDVANAFFIFDEQRVVGNGTWVKSFYKITKHNSWILLSATPGDTWTDYIPVFIANGFYKNRSEFLREHAVYSYYTKYPKITKFINQGRLIRYRDSILVNMEYRHATIHHDEDVIVNYDIQGYKKIFNERLNPETNEPIENISQLCYLMRKEVNSDISRLNKILELTEIHKKAIIFYNFDYELELLKNLDYIKGTEIAEWNGHNHEPIPKEKSRWVYLVQYTAGSEGWNCIETDTIIFFSQSYSYKAMIQAAGRIDRLTTPFTDLFYYHLRSNAPIDIAINKALKRKRNFNELSFLS